MSSLKGHLRLFSSQTQNAAAAAYSVSRGRTNECSGKTVIFSKRISAHLTTHKPLRCYGAVWTRRGSPLPPPAPNHGRSARYLAKSCPQASSRGSGTRMAPVRDPDPLILLLQDIGASTGGGEGAGRGGPFKGDGEEGQSWRLGGSRGGVTCVPAVTT